MLHIYNTLTRQKEPFRPIASKTVKLYVCGITVYDHCHIGHARTFLAFDMIVRYLRYLDYQVRFVRNITDIDDKIIQRANEQQTSPSALAQHYTEAMHQDMQQLRLVHPDAEPKATEYVEKMVRFVETLIEKQVAYCAENGDVYYSVRACRDYGKLSRCCLADLKAGARVDINTAKRDELDFVLWKTAKPNEPSWPSPWGAGRPGWHLECSVMAMDCLGQSLDIHGGGHDLMFPHHENEIAQSESLTGVAFVKTWMHTGFLEINQEKMSKSLNNFFTVKEVLAQYDPEVLRFFMLNSHYRSALAYSPEGLEQAKSGLTRWYTALRGLDLGSAVALENTAYQTAFEQAMNDDFNTPEAFAVLFDMAHEIQRLKETQPKQAMGLGALLKQLAGSLGLLYQSREAYFQHSLSASNETLSLEAIESYIQQRYRARDNQDWAKADAIRKTLAQHHIVLEDTKEGTLWRRS